MAGMAMTKTKTMMEAAQRGAQASEEMRQVQFSRRRVSLNSLQSKSSKSSDQTAETDKSENSEARDVVRHLGDPGHSGYSSGNESYAERMTRRRFSQTRLEDLRNTIRENLQEDPKLGLHDYYKDEGVWQLIAKSWWFENITLLVIALNAFWLAIDTNHNKADSLAEADLGFVVAENVFCIYFTTELFIRFMAFKRKSDTLMDRWFIFDCILVCMMVLETWVLVGIVLLLDDSNVSLGDAAVLKLFRLLRLSRLARMLRSMPELMIMIKGALRAARSVFFVMALLLIITYVFGIALTQLSEGTDSAELYFSSVPHAMYSLLLYGTLLDNLVKISNRLVIDSTVCVVMFYIFVLLSALTVLNMLIGVLCEVVSRVAAVEKDHILTSTTEEKLYAAVSKLDQDGDRKLSKKEFLRLLLCPEAAQALSEIGVDPSGVVDFADVIFDEDGKEQELEFEDFMHIILQLRGSNDATVRHMIELKRMVEMQLEDLATAAQESSRRSSTDSLGRSIGLSLRSVSPTPSNGVGAWAQPKQLESSRSSAQLLPGTAAVPIGRRLPSPLSVRVSSEVAPDLLWADHEPSDCGSEGGSPKEFVPPSFGTRTRGSSPARQHDCQDSSSTDLGKELSELRGRTERVEDMMANVLREVQKLSRQLQATAFDSSDDEESFGNEATIRSFSPCSVPQGELGIPSP